MLVCSQFTKNKMMKSTMNILKKCLVPKHKRFFSQDSCDTKIENDIVVERVGEITIIGLNRPSKRNCINYSMAENLKKALQTFETDDSSCAAVLHGIGGNFSAGIDLTQLTHLDSENLNKNEVLQLGLPLRLINKPLVAALSGYAVAEGFEIALMCDLRVMEDNAVVGMYNRRFGISCSNGGIVHLSSIVGLSRALDIILTGRTVTAQEAFQWGLANRIVACGTALGQAIQIAGSLAKFPQECLLQDRKTLYESAFCHSFEKLLEYERNNGINVFNEESINGAKKFVELGIGKHGKTYHLKKKTIPNWEEE